MVFLLLHVFHYVMLLGYFPGLSVCHSVHSTHYTTHVAILYLCETFIQTEVASDQYNIKYGTNRVRVYATGTKVCDLQSSGR